ncbi:MAG TPA: glycosyltransferase family 87 protein [Candidatus Dormibacteraeota bacterium]|nr:glycosyltransferase family 87 protein [Candidatus Dormibacteraeota bacterium]
MSTPSPTTGTRPAPGTRSVRPAFIAQASLIGTALAIYGLVVVQSGFRHQDFGAYLAAGHSILSGQPLYAAFLHHPFPDPTLRPAYIYPPVFALLIAPLALLPVDLAGAIWLLICQGCLAASLLIVIRWLRPAAWALTAITVATLTFYPLWIDAVQGQANLIVVFLVTGGVAGIVRGDPRFGAALGLAAALKLTPALLLVWLLLDRRFRAAAWMLGSVAAVTVAAALVRGSDSVAFFTQVVPALARGTAVYANQSLSGLLGRVASANPYTDPWLTLSWMSLLATAAAIVLVAVWYWRSRDQQGLARAAAFVPLLPLLSSVTWPHHLVILLPVIWFAAIAIAERGWPVAQTVMLATLLILFSVVSRLPLGPAFNQPGFRQAQTQDPIVFLVANSLFFATLLLFIAGPWLLRSR